MARDSLLMANAVSLTEVAYTTRKTLKIGSISLLVIFVIWFLAKSGIEAWQKMHPAPPPPPTVGFGVLPAVPFPDQQKPPLTFVLQTPTGGFPDFPNEAKIYFMPKTGSSFSDLDYATKQARSLGFQGDPVKLTDVDYQWTGQNGFTFKTNIISHTFMYDYDYIANQSLLGPQRLPGPDQVGQEAKGFISRAVNLPDDLANGKAKFTYFKIVANKLTPVQFLSDADFIQVGLFRGDYDQLPVVAPDPQKGYVWLLYVNSTDLTKQFVHAEYQYFPVDSQRWETYPLKTAQAAWDELRNSKYYLANLDEQHGNSITVRRVSLAYYDPPKQVGAMTPVYVFEGDSNFMGYVPAVDPGWVAG